jgi:hypothetical protein
MTNNELLVITNNPLVEKQINLENYWIEGDCEEVIKQTYNRVSIGHLLVSHPLAGSIKPNQNPYKSILISKVPGEIDMVGLRLIENCLRKTEELMVNKNEIDLKTRYENDLQLADQSLLLSALQSIEESR